MPYLTVKRAIEIFQTLDPEILVSIETPDDGAYFITDSYKVWKYDDGNFQHHFVSFKDPDEAISSWEEDECTLERPMGP